MTQKNAALHLSFLFMTTLLGAPQALEKVIFQEGVIMGYTLGQNGMSWPAPLKDPLANNNRGGFYISQLRLKATIPFDSTFSAVFTGNIIYQDVQEAYLEKRWGQYGLKVGKFRGAGLKSGSGTDEFARTAVNAPRYTRVADYWLRTFNYRDFGLQLEKTGRNGALQQRFFIHNANRQNVVNDEPSYPETPATQALGFDYALDWRISPFTVLGGHAGALANKGWDEFVGHHNGWEAGYWFKSNPIVDASIYHQMDFTRLHILNEALLMYLRDLPSPVDSTATQTWGVSSLITFDYSQSWGGFFRYEFLDPTDGLTFNDNAHMATIGAIFHPSPNLYPKLKLTGEYVRCLEEGVRNRMPNDLLYMQLQMEI